MYANKYGMYVHAFIHVFYRLVNAYVYVIAVN